MPFSTLWAFGTMFFSSAAPASELVKTCPAANVRSVAISTVVRRDTTGRGDDPKIEVSPIAQDEQKHFERNVVLTTIYGPMLGSMDSPKLAHSVSCTPDGINLDIHITRSEAFHGAVLQNVNWVPKVVTQIESKLPQIVLHVQWTMTLSNGVVVSRSRTPPFPERAYPIIMKKTIHWR